MYLAVKSPSEDVTRHPRFSIFLKGALNSVSIRNYEIQAENSVFILSFLCLFFFFLKKPGCLSLVLHLLDFAAYIPMMSFNTVL